jgi:circadian clock protein KaiC
VYVTLLAETHARMLAHLEPLSFFDERVVGKIINYISAYKTLEEQGRAGLLSLLQRLVREHNATLLVLDGLATLQVTADTGLGFKHFVHELQTFIGLTGCTTFLLSDASEGRRPEQPVVDGVLELREQMVGFRAVRKLIVSKLRGGDYLRGRHHFDITGDGVKVYPRIEAQFAKPEGRLSQPQQARRGFGIRELDEMMRGGFSSGTSGVLIGGPGTGKTVLGLHFLAAGADQDQPGIYLGFNESPERLMREAKPLGIDLERHVEQGRVEVFWQPPLEHNIDGLGHRLLEMVKRQKTQRIFLDGLSGIREVALPSKRTGRFLTALLNQLRSLEVTTLFSEESPVFGGPVLHLPGAAASAVVENIVFMQHVAEHEKLRRQISILKMRGTAFDTSVREFVIGERGIEMAPADDERLSRGDPTWERSPRSRRKRGGSR